MFQKLVLIAQIQLYAISANKKVVFSLGIHVAGQLMKRLAVHSIQMIHVAAIIVATIVIHARILQTNAVLDQVTHVAGLAIQIAVMVMLIHVAAITKAQNAIHVIQLLETQIHVAEMKLDAVVLETQIAIHAFKTQRERVALKHFARKIQMIQLALIKTLALEFHAQIAHLAMAGFVAHQMHAVLTQPPPAVLAVILR